MIVKSNTRCLVFRYVLHKISLSILGHKRLLPKFPLGPGLTTLSCASFCDEDWKQVLIRLGYGTWWYWNYVSATIGLLQGKAYGPFTLPNSIRNKTFHNRALDEAPLHSPSEIYQESPSKPSACTAASQSSTICLSSVSN